MMMSLSLLSSLGRAMLSMSKHWLTWQTASSGPPSSALGLDWYSRDLTHTVSKDSPKMSSIFSLSARRRTRHESTLHWDPSLERLVEVLGATACALWPTLATLV